VARIYSERLFYASPPATSGVYYNTGGGTAVVHDMIFGCSLDATSLGQLVRLGVTGSSGLFILWRLMAFYMQPLATYHWTGRIVIPAGDTLEWVNDSPSDSFVGYGYYLTP
jgi:hypothetical protein